MSDLLKTIIRSLSFSRDRRSALQEIANNSWPSLLRQTDAAQLTLPLATRCRDYVPSFARDRLDDNLRNNAERHRVLMQTYADAAGLLGSKGIDFLVLKGFTHWPDFASDLRYRPQYDLDLYCSPDRIVEAYELIQTLGYEPFRSRAHTAVDHLEPLIRRTGWRFDGDYFSPSLPITIELHFRFWDSSTEAFEVSDSGDFWRRRIKRAIMGQSVPSLAPLHALSYATWHLVRHLVRGNVRACHVYELAYYLHHSQHRANFWREWEASNPSIVEAVAFLLAMSWFECDAHPIALSACERLPSSIRRWFDLFAFSPAAALEHPNKDELFLHCCLVKDWRTRLAVVRRRLLPSRFDTIVADAHVASPDWRLRLKRKLVGAYSLALRVLHHARTIPPLVRSGFRWSRGSTW